MKKKDKEKTSKKKIKVIDIRIDDVKQSLNLIIINKGNKDG